MAKYTLDQLQRLSDKIHAEEMSVLMEFCGPVFLGEEFEGWEPPSLQEYTQRKNYVSLLLRSLRIHLCLDLIREGHTSCAEYFKNDWKEFLESLKFLEGVLEDSGEVLSDAVDIILLLGPEKRNDLLRQLGFSARLKIRKRRPLRADVPCNALPMADYCLETGRKEEFRRIISNLIFLSEERNEEKPALHRQLIISVLRHAVDPDPELTCRLCESQQHYFDGVVDPNACLFYWFYGVSMAILGQQQEALPLLEKCHTLCMAVEGETSWIGMRAEVTRQSYLLYRGDAAAAERYLWDSLKKTDEGFYPAMDMSADFVSANTLAVLLAFHQDKQTIRRFLPELIRFRDYCVSLEASSKSPLLTVRHAENLLSTYYMETGDYLLSADHALNALQSIPPNNLEAYPSDVILYTNLLLIYSALNDAEKKAYYMRKLESMSDEFEDDSYAKSRVSLITSSVTARQQGDPKMLEQYRQQLREFSFAITRGEFQAAESTAENVTFAQWILTLCSGLLDSGTATRDELFRCRKLIKYFWQQPERYPFNDAQKLSCYLLLAVIQDQLGARGALSYIEQGLRYIDTLSDVREAYITVLRTAAAMYYAYNRTDEALSMVDRVLSGITSAWQKATAYLNDHKVCQLLSLIQPNFNVCCAVLRAAADSAELYERVLQFKDLPALVGRERNRLLRLAPVDEELKEQIFALQDQLAAAELNDSLRGTNTAQDVAARLERKEAAFAAQFPQNLSFTEISFDRVCQKLPDNCAILEYFVALGSSAFTRRVYREDDWELDIFVTVKRNGAAQLHHIRLPRADLILAQASEFIYILQNPEDLAASGRKPSLRAGLYRSLIAPALPFLKGISGLYIAPDDRLCNLPFEILCADGSGLLQDNYRICRLVCGRDLLFCDDRDTSGGSSFILGGPNYESEQGERSLSRTRGGMQLEPVSDLPFSAVEAVHVGRRCRSAVYSGDAATKYALQEALPCSIIHLATHGMFDEQLESDSLYSSHLVFAGYNKWVTNKTESSRCGNGVLTADEISRMDLRKTELVVLSACQSGLGDTSFGSVRGLLSAFSAAGARWMISHMWKANDFATAVLMDAFYSAYLSRGMDVPDALQYAKQHLRTVTIRELHQEGWLDLPKDIPFPESIRWEISDMRTWPENETPFADEFCWGGFTVHKSR